MDIRQPYNDNLLDLLAVAVGYFRPRESFKFDFCFVHSCVFQSLGMLVLAASGKRESTICESAFVHSAMIHEPVLNKLNTANAKKYPYPQLNVQPKHCPKFGLYNRNVCRGKTRLPNSEWSCAFDVFIVSFPVNGGVQLLCTGLGNLPTSGMISPRRYKLLA